MTRAAVLRDPAISQGIGQFGAIQSVPPSLGVAVSAGEVIEAIANDQLLLVLKARKIPTACTSLASSPLATAKAHPIARLRRDEISDKDHTATIPGSRSKNKRPHVVPLSPLAWDILQSVQTKGDHGFALAINASSFSRVMLLITESVFTLLRSGMTGEQVNAHLADVLMPSMVKLQRDALGIFNAALHGDPAAPSHTLQ